MLKSGNTSRESPKAAWSWPPLKAAVPFDPVYPSSSGPTLLSLISNLDSLEIGNVISVLSLSAGCISPVWEPVAQSLEASLKWKCCCGWPPRPSTVSHSQAHPEMKLPRCRGDFQLLLLFPHFPLTLVHSVFFASGKEARFAESSLPRTLSGHLIPIRYFSLLSCSSLSWASCFYPSLPPTRPHCWTLPSSLLFPCLCPHSLNPSQSECVVWWINQQPTLLSCVHSYAESWQPVTEGNVSR